MGSFKSIIHARCNTLTASAKFLQRKRRGYGKGLVGHGASSALATLLQRLGNKHDSWCKDSEDSPGQEQRDTSVHSSIEGSGIVEDVLGGVLHALLKGDSRHTLEDGDEEKGDDSVDGHDGAPQDNNNETRLVQACLVKQRAKKPSWCVTDRRSSVCATLLVARRHGGG